MRGVFLLRYTFHMSPLFGKKKQKGPERTLLVLDIENGSAGSALLRLSPGAQPKLFGERRMMTPVTFTRSGSALAADIERATLLAMQNAAEVSARIRNNATAAALGDIDSVAVFMAPPWGTPDLSGGKPSFMPAMQDFTRGRVRDTFGELPVSFYTSAGAAAFGARALMTKEPCLVCAVTGEVSQLLQMDGQGVRAHATFPSGLHSVLRTLRSHGGLSEQEARSVMRLPMQTPHMQEPFAAAAGEFSQYFKDAARGLIIPGDVLRVMVIAPDASADWFAQALSTDQSLAELFPDGGEVRALRANHAAPHVAAHAETPDLHLLLDALFVDSHFNS